MAEADGQWGYALFREELQEAKIRVLDRLSQVKQNAQELEAIRLAGSGPRIGSPVEQTQKEETEHEPRP